MKIKKWQIAVIVIVVIGVVGAIAGSGSKNDEKKSSTPATKETSKKDDDKQAEKVFKIGEMQKVGKVEYTVKAKEVTDSIGDEPITKKAQNKFLVVTVTIKNDGKEALTVLDSFFKLKDGDKTFDTDSGSSVYLTKDSILAKKINPDSSLTGKIVFDIAQETVDAKDLQLQVQTGSWGTEKGYFYLNK